MSSNDILYNIIYKDTPSSKVTVEAHIRVPKIVKCVFSGLLSSQKESENDNKLTHYHFTQKNPIPTYLIVLAAGDIEYSSNTERTGIWAEKELLAKATYEFANADLFIKKAEEYLDSPYVWGKYDILVLPMSFPYGGMENPTITFLSPTAVAGDQSLENIVAHEIAHSWTGNCVTNYDWTNFWLNEGFTVFLERKIIELVYGEDIFKLLCKVGYDGLLNAISSIGQDHSHTSLTPDINGVI